MSDQLVGYTSDGYSIYSDGSGNCYAFDDTPVSGMGYLGPVSCPMSASGSNPYPSVSVNPGGFSVLTTNLDKIMNSILSGFAIAKGAPYIPTTTQPVKQNYATPYGTAGYPAGYNPLGSNVNTGATIQTWLQKNIVVVGIAAAAFMLYRTQPTSRR